MKYVECEQCGMVMYGAEEGDPVPKAHEACPSCEGTAFCWVD